MGDNKQQEYEKHRKKERSRWLKAVKRKTGKKRVEKKTYHSIKSSKLI